MVGPRGLWDHRSPPVVRDVCMPSRPIETGATISRVIPRRPREAPPVPSPAPGAHRRRASLRLHLVRSSSDRLVAGVGAGLAERLGVDHVVIRLAFVVLAFAGGVGVVGYLVLWLMSPEADGGERTVATFDRRTIFLKTVAVGMVVGGTLLVLRQAGVWFGDAVVWPAALAAFGSALIWVRADEHSRARWSRVAARVPRNPVEALFTGPVSRTRIALGALLIAGGMAAFLAANNAFAAVRGMVFAAAVTATGLLLIVGPGMWRLGRQLAEERRERIRSEERAEMAAHLHDSVLQTLAMIQRAPTPQQMSTLARAQERELRTWLYGRRDGHDPALLGAAMEDQAARIERLHDVPIEVVTVGDCPMDDRLQPLVQAAGEAMANASKHARVSRVSVYVEVEPDAVTAFVRDQGRGFDLESVPPDRRGIADSIRGRMERAGGEAVVDTTVGEGTEVRLRLPREER